MLNTRDCGGDASNGSHAYFMLKQAVQAQTRYLLRACFLPWLRQRIIRR